MAAGTATTDWRVERDAALLRIERESTPPLRAEAAEVLCDLAYDLPAELRPELAPAVVRLIADRQDEVRCAGLALASEVLAPEESQALFIRHLSEKSPRVRVEATGRLADLAREDARGALAAALQDESFEVRFEAARGMAALQHTAGLEVLTQALGSTELRFRAAAALALLGSRDAIPALQRAFGRWFMPAFDRTQLAGALAKLGAPEGVAHLFKRAAKSWSMDRAMAIELLGEVRAPGAKERLCELVKQPKDSCRGAAARALGRLGDQSVAPVLLAVLDEPALTDDVRLDVAEGLLRLRSEAGRARLETLKLTDPEAREELASMLAHPP